MMSMTIMYHRALSISQLLYARCVSTLPESGAIQDVNQCSISALNYKRARCAHLADDFTFTASLNADQYPCP